MVQPNGGHGNKILHETRITKGKKEENPPSKQGINMGRSVKLWTLLKSNGGTEEKLETNQQILQISRDREEESGFNERP